MAVQDAARAVGVKGAALAVLSYMCSASAFTKPTVCVSKDTICERTGYTMKTVKAARARLRDLGIIVPVACIEGGRHRATIYKLTTKAGKGGENCPPNAEDGEKGGSFSQKGGQFFPERGVKNTPPSISSSISSSRGEKGRGLVAPDAAAHAASAPDDTDRLEREAFRQAMRECNGDLDRASAWMATWRAQQAADLP